MDIPIILKPLYMVLCSSREIVSLKLKKGNLTRPPVYDTGSNEPSYASKFACPDNKYL
jgi:hypothetical protein